MSTETKAHLRNADTWIRGLFILIFALFYGVAEVVLTAIVLFQFVSQLFTGKTNDKLLEFSRGLTAYFYQLLQFFTYRSDFKPFPFSDWPDAGLEGEPEELKQQAAQAKEPKQPQEGEKKARKKALPEAKTEEEPPEPPPEPKP